MALVALVAWLGTVSIGLYLLAIWLIEYDREFQSVAATRLPVPVIGTHALLALGGLAVWALYLITDAVRLAWVAAGTLGVVATLGLTMAARWIGVRRAHEAPRAVAVPVGARPGSDSISAPVPPERYFPAPVVVMHGIFAGATIVLVLLTAFRAAGS